MTSIGDRVRVTDGKIEDNINPKLSMWVGTPYKSARIMVGIGDDGDYYGLTCETIYKGNRVIVHPGNFGIGINYAATRATPYTSGYYYCTPICEGIVSITGSNSMCLLKATPWLSWYTSSAPSWYRQDCSTSEPHFRVDGEVNGHQNRCYTYNVASPYKVIKKVKITYRGVFEGELFVLGCATIPWYAPPFQYYQPYIIVEKNFNHPNWITKTFDDFQSEIEPGSTNTYLGKLMKNFAFGSHGTTTSGTDWIEVKEFCIYQ